MLGSRHHRKIISYYDPKPGPDHRFNWEAVDDNIDDLTGYGATEAEAVADLFEHLEIRALRSTKP